ncbi:DUF188 domain-containing protein [Bacillus licheniformis]|nr:DUF188 domain-containing protein [Bacillus licheniformis]
MKCSNSGGFRRKGGIRGFIRAFQITRKEEENWTYVDPHKEAADLYIANHVRPGDVVVTQDIGLASLLLGKRSM